jgi:tRNA (guanine-N7-)-methyltransferase
MDFEQLKKHRHQHHRDLSPEVYQRMVQTNPYLKRVQEFPEILLPFPEASQIEAHWEPKRRRAQRVHVEIGCGSGRYLRAWAELHPQDAFLGFELRYKRLTLAARKIAQANLSNVLLVKDRGELLGDYLPEQSLAVLHVNFPDPWPKKAHRKHRLFSTEFLNRLQPLMREEGEIRFKSDHREYFDAVTELLRAHPTYEITEHTHDLWGSAYAEQNVFTEFEQLFQSKGFQHIGFLRARCRPSSSSPA